jgi:hypothetical protein
MKSIYKNAWRSFLNPPVHILGGLAHVDQSDVLLGQIAVIDFLFQDTN